MKFGDRLRSLRLNQKMTQKELADKLSLSPSTIGMYEQNRRVPDPDILSKLSFIFGVSVDYLLGKQNELDQITANATILIFSIPMWETCISKIKERLSELNISESEYCAKREIDLSSLYRATDFLKVARELDISIDFLFGLSDVSFKKEDVDFLRSLSEREKNIIDTFRQLHPDNQDIMVGELKKCLKEQRLESVAADQKLKQAK